MASRFEKELVLARWPQSAAELATGGVTRDMTRGPHWRRTSRGYFTPTSAGDPTPTQRILDVTPLIPVTGALTSWAAAYVQGVDQLDGLDPGSMAPLPITINLGRDLGRVSTERITYRRDLLSPEGRRACHGLFVVTPLRTAFDGARYAPDLVEAVAFLDQVTHVLPVSMAALRSLLRPSGRWTGIEQFRRAVALTDPAAANAWESRLRMFAMLQAEMPRLLVNQPVFDLDERLLGIPDLLDPEAALALEFDGQDHRKRRQHQSDNLREEGLELTNLTVCRVDSLDLRQPAALRARLRARRAQALARDRSRDRWTLEQPDWWRRREARRISGSERG